VCFFGGHQLATQEGPRGFRIWHEVENLNGEPLDDRPLKACPAHLAEAIWRKEHQGHERAETLAVEETYLATRLAPRPAAGNDDLDPGPVSDYPCCGQQVGDGPDDCPGTCDSCGFSLCPEAQDVVRCDCT
jgi:hypothetical protein